MIVLRGTSNLEGPLPRLSSHFRKVDGQWARELFEHFSRPLNTLLPWTTRYMMNNLFLSRLAWQISASYCQRRSNLVFNLALSSGDTESSNHWGMNMSDRSEIDLVKVCWCTRGFFHPTLFRFLEGGNVAARGLLSGEGRYGLLLLLPMELLVLEAPSDLGRPD